MTFKNLCEECALAKLVFSQSGSRFLRCSKSKEDKAYAKYPPQPVLRCPGHVSGTPSGD
jgi:hypothetical protein